VFPLSYTTPETPKALDPAKWPKMLAEFPAVPVKPIRASLVLKLPSALLMLKLFELKK
jgi:hypothetical protein